MTSFKWWGKELVPNCSPVPGQLQEMFLLVDAASQLQDVEQVELNFRRHEDTADS